MSVTPERFEIPRGQKVAITVLAGVMFALALVVAFFAWHGVDGAADPRASAVGFTLMASFFTGMGALSALGARQAWRSAVTLRDGGVEIDRGDQMPSFIGWGQMGGLRTRSASGGTAVLGLGGEKLFAVDSRLDGVGRLLHAILVNGVLPKRSPILPYSATQSVPRQIPAAIAIALAVGGFGLLTNTPAEARPVVLISFAAIAVVVAGIAALASRLGAAGKVTIDADGITIGRAERRPWSGVQGAALAFVRGPKGERFPRVALQGLDGRWEPVNLPGTDLVELLAAINAAAPGKIVDPPDQPLGLSNRLTFSIKKDVTFRIGPPKG